MNNNSKILVGIIAFAGAAAAVILLLKTESGKRVLAEIKEATGKALQGWKNAAVDANGSGTAS